MLVSWDGDRCVMLKRLDEEQSGWGTEPHREVRERCFCGPIVESLAGQAPGPGLWYASGESPEGLKQGLILTTVWRRGSQSETHFSGPHGRWGEGQRIPSRSPRQGVPCNRSVPVWIPLGSQLNKLQSSRTRVHICHFFLGAASMWRRQRQCGWYQQKKLQIGIQAGLSHHWCQQVEKRSTSRYNNLQVLVAFNNRSFSSQFSCTDLQGWPLSSQGSERPQTAVVWTVMCLCLSWASNWLISDLFHVSLVRTRPHKHPALRGLGKPRSGAGSASLLRRSGSAVRCWLERTAWDEAGALPSFSLTNETTDSLWHQFASRVGRFSFCFRWCL